MKKTLFSLAFALVAMLGFQTVNAQSLSSYTSNFDAGTSTLEVSGKVGGLGKKVATMEVELFLEVEASVDCEKETSSAKNPLLENTFYRFSANSNSISVSGKGSTDFGPIAVTASGSATCPTGWDFVAGGNATVIRAWIVLTTRDIDGNVLNISDEIDINW